MEELDHGVELPPLDVEFGDSTPGLDQLPTTAPDWTPPDLAEKVADLEAFRRARKSPRTIPGMIRGDS